LPLQIDDELFPEAAQAVQDVAEKCGILVLLVGAYARDLLLEDLGAARTPRRTCDVDFGVKADSWDEFRRLKDALLASGRFQPFKAGGHPHKLLFLGKMEVNLVPFGGVADEGGRRVGENSRRQP